MRVKDIALLAAWAVASWSAARAQEPFMVTKPDWVQRPTAEDVARNYPPLAARGGIGGHVTINCGINASGELENCAVTEETPKDQGFGGAVLAMTSLFRMKPTTLEGKPAAGGQIAIPLTFCAGRSVESCGRPKPSS
jgi:TonB family protein